MDYSRYNTSDKSGFPRTEDELENSEMYDVTMSSPHNSIQQTEEDRHSQHISSLIFDSFKKIRTTTLQSIHEVVQEEDRNTSTFAAGFNVTNLIQGIGIVGVPYSVRMGGWASVVVIVFTAVCCCFTGQMLIDCLYDICPLTKVKSRVMKTYSCLGEKVWPRFGKRIVTCVLLTEMMGGLMLYIILMATMSSTLMKGILPGLDIYYWSLITTYSTIVLLFVTKMSIISWFSLIGVLGLLSTIVVIFVFCFLNVYKISVSNMPAFDPMNFPVCIGIVVFSYCAHGVFPSIEGSMRHPENYNTMLKVAFILAAICKVVMGVLAVLIFGNDTEQEFTQNMSGNMVISILISIVVLANVFFSTPLVAYVILERVDTLILPHFHPNFHDGGKLSFLWKFLTRAFILTFCLFIAMLVPHFALLMSFVGSITGTCLSFVFPCIFHLSIKGDDLSKFGIVMRYLVIIYGIAMGALGAIFSMKRIVHALSGNSDT